MIALRSALIVAMFSAAAFAATKDLTLYFNPARLTAEVRGKSLLFRYDDPNCKYVEHGAGAPVLPCVQVYVLMPKGAVYRGCRLRANSRPYRGTHSLYVRQAQPGAASAQQYPPNLVEFVGQKDVRGYRLFVFRAFPVMCQPADGSVARITQTTLAIEYDVSGADSMYAPNDARVTAWMRNAVVNPDDLETFTRQSTTSATATGNIASVRDYFATDIRTRVVSSSANDDGGFFAALKENVYINKENDIVYAPIRF